MHEKIQNNQKEMKVLLKEEYGEQNVSQDRHESHVVYVALK